MAKIIDVQIDMAGNLITDLGDGVSSGDAVNKGQLDAAVAAATVAAIKAPCRAATTANITLSGAQTIDAVSVIAGDRVLVKDQTTGADNGIYVCAAGAWSRATDADTSGEVPPGMLVAVSDGTANGDKVFLLTTDATITLGTTALSFAQVSGSGGSAGSLEDRWEVVLDGDPTTPSPLVVDGDWLYALVSD